MMTFDAENLIYNKISIYSTDSKLWPLKIVGKIGILDCRSHRRYYRYLPGYPVRCDPSRCRAGWGGRHLIPCIGVALLIQGAVSLKILWLITSCNRKLKLWFYLKDLLFESFCRLTTKRHCLYFVKSKLEPISPVGTLC